MKEYTYIVKGEKYTVNIEDIQTNLAKVTVNGIPFDVEIDRPQNTTSIRPKVTKPVSSQTTITQKQATPTPSASPAPSVAPTSNTGKPLKAPLPGVIQDITTSVGAVVKKGDTVIVLEAMKMANNITAECDGTIVSINVNKGDSVMEGHILLTIA